MALLTLKVADPWPRLCCRFFSEPGKDEAFNLGCTVRD